MKQLWTITTFLLLATWFAGCVAPRTLTTQPVKSVLPQQVVPANLAGVSKGMSGLVWLGIVICALSVGAVFVVPNHTLPLGCLAVGVTLLFLALAVQITLPFLPWVGAGLVALGLAWLAKRMFFNKAATQ